MPLNKAQNEKKLRKYPRHAQTIFVFNQFFKQMPVHVWKQNQVAYNFLTGNQSKILNFVFVDAQNMLKIKQFSKV